MKERFFVFDVSLCFGCQGCVAASVNANRLKGDQHWRKVFKLPCHDGKNDTIYLSMSCNHCEEPACVKACPADALRVREEDRIVVLESDKCLGCRYCQMACPYDAIVWMEDTKTVGKCNLCYERLDREEEPACVGTCFSGALQLITVDYEAERGNWEKEMIGFEHHPDVKPRLRFVNKFKSTLPKGNK